MSYTPPTGRYGTTDEQHDAYMAAHSAGWSHANYVAAYGSSDGETVSEAAQRRASERYTVSTRVYLRAVEGFTDGAEEFDASDRDDIDDLGDVDA